MSQRNRDDVVVGAKDVSPHSPADALPEGFKMTELGPLPEEWRVVRLGEVAILKQGKTPKRAQYDDKHGARIIKVKDFQDGGQVSIKPTGDRSFVTVDLGSFRVKGGDVLILNSGHSPSVVGQKVGVVPRELDGSFFVAELTAIRSVDQVSDPYFLFACLMYSQLRERIRELVKGGHLYVNQLKTVPIPLPPLPEQRAIAYVLRTVQEAKEATDRVIAALRDLKKSLMRHLFTYGPVPIGEQHTVPLQETEIGPIPAHWRVVKLGEVVEKAKQVDPRKKPDWNFKYVDVSSISNTKLSIETWSEISGENAPSRARKLVKEGDIIFATVRPYLKRIAMVPAHLDGHVVSTAFCVIRCKAELATPNYVFFAVSLDNFVQRVVEQQRGSSYPAVTDKDVLNGLTPLPPLSEQQEIARMLQAVDARIEAEEKKKAALEALFKTLLHHLMTAKIRLPEEFVARFAEATP